MNYNAEDNDDGYTNHKSSVVCPACGGTEAEELGTLGTKKWYRCIACGIDFNNEGGDNV